MIRLATITALLLITATTSASAAAANVTLDLEALGVDYKACEVAVPVGSNGGDVLDAAVGAGCISSWSYTDFGFGRFVDCIDGVCGTAATFWEFSVNGVSASFGIDDYHAAPGDVVGFNYVEWVVPLP